MLLYTWCDKYILQVKEIQEEFYRHKEDTVSGHPQQENGTKILGRQAWSNHGMYIAQMSNNALVRYHAQSSPNFMHVMFHLFSEYEKHMTSMLKDLIK